MVDPTENLGFDDSFELPSTDEFNDQSGSTVYNGTIIDSPDSFNADFIISNDTMRFLFVAIATITILICLTICISVFICICLNRRRSIKRQDMKDQRLLPEQSETISTKKLPLINSIPKPIILNGKQQFDKEISSSTLQNSSSNIITNKPLPIKSYYYGNLDDIPFIDESRPTSFIDMTRV